MKNLKIFNKKKQLYYFLKYSKKFEWYISKKNERFLYSMIPSSLFCLIGLIIWARINSVDGIISLSELEHSTLPIVFVVILILFGWLICKAYTNCISNPVNFMDCYKIFKEYFMESMIGTADAPIIVQFPDKCVRERFYCSGVGNDIIPYGTSKIKTETFRTLLFLYDKHDRVQLIFNESYLRPDDDIKVKGMIICQCITDVKVIKIQKGKFNDEVLLTLKTIENEEIGTLKLKIGLENRYKVIEDLKKIQNRIETQELITQNP